jgi:cell division septum initiation protein DivIVA
MTGRAKEFELLDLSVEQVERLYERIAEVEAEVARLQEVVASEREESDELVDHLVVLTRMLDRRIAASDKDRRIAELEAGVAQLRNESVMLRGSAEAAERARDTADRALYMIGTLLGSSDEWTDQASMIADVIARVEAVTRPTEKASHE